MLDQESNRQASTSSPLQPGTGDNGLEQIVLKGTPSDHEDPPKLPASILGLSPSAIEHSTIHVSDMFRNHIGIVANPAPKPAPRTCPIVSVTHLHVLIWPWPQPVSPNTANFRNHFLAFSKRLGH